MNDKAQVAPFLVILIAILLVAILATYRIGRVAMDKLRMMNTVDSAIISSASELCRGLNQIRQINVGPGGLFLKWIQTQTALLSAGVWPNKFVPILTICLPAVVETKLMIDGGSPVLAPWRKVTGARELAQDLTRGIRAGLFDAVFYSLVDEPKPFQRVASAPRRGGQRGEQEEIELDYEEWLGRESYLSDINRPNSYLWFKKEHPQDNEETGEKAWYKYPALSYSWNRTAKEVTARGGRTTETRFIPGKIYLPNEEVYYSGGSYGDRRPYDASVTTEITNFPGEITLNVRLWLLVYFYLKGGAPMIGFFPYPYAWIRQVNMGGNSIGVSVTRKSPQPFSAQQEELTQTSTATITGDVWWNAYHFSLERE